MRKLSKYIFILGMLIIIIGIVITVFDNNTRDVSKPITNTEVYEDKLLEFRNLKVEKLYRSCTYKFQIYRENLAKINFDYYDIYMLDNNNNLIYIIKGSNMGEVEFPNGEHILEITGEVNYDISSATKGVLSFRQNKYKYDKDFTNKLKKMPIEE